MYLHRMALWSRMGQDVLLRFRPMRAERVPILNELCPVWGGRTYAEQPLVSLLGFIDAGVVFPSGVLATDSPTRADIDATIDRALIWVCAL